MNNSRSLFRRARRIFPGGVNSPVRYFRPYPAYIVSGEAQRVRDADGNIYTDYVLGYGPLILGHTPAPVLRSIYMSARNGIMFGAPTVQEIELAELILGTCRSADMIRFVPSGSEATMHALRLALHHTRRKKILKVKGGYHGSHPLVISNENLSEIEFNDIESLGTELSTREYAAFIVEPVMGNSGLISPREGYLKAVREETERTGTVFIADEVITGFRTCFGLYTERNGIFPDLVTVGKIIGGGLPLAAFAGDRNLMRNVRPAGDMMQAGTYSAHPVSVASGLSTLKRLKNTNYERLSELTRMAAGFLSDSGCSVAFETGMLSAFMCSTLPSNGSEVARADRQAYFSVFRRMLKKGVYLPPSQDELVFFSFAHHASDVRRDFSLMAGEIRSVLGL